MFAYISDLLQNAAHNIFFASAIIGATLFALRMLAIFFGGDFATDDTDVDFDAEGHHHDEPSFKLFTLHSLSGFFMMFGIAGLACTEQYQFSHTYSIIIAFAVGFSTMVIIALLLRGALFFESRGNVFCIEKTKGLTGTVYQRIPENGQGKISIVVNGATRELLAQSANKKAIESFAIVTVVDVVDYEIVQVIEVRQD